MTQLFVMSLQVQRRLLPVFTFAPLHADDVGVEV